MCLRIKKSDRPCTASENLKVYKVYHNTIFGDLLSYYRVKETKRGEQPRVRIERFDYPSDYHSLNGPDYIESQYIESGYHSFKNLEDARDFVHDQRLTVWNAKYKEVSIYQCTIPSGTQYYRGMFLKKYQSLASETITVDKEVEIFEFQKIW